MKKKYTVKAIDSTDDVHLPWKVTIDGPGQCSSYYTVGTVQQAFYNAQKTVKRLNRERKWAITFSLKEFKSN